MRALFFLFALASIACGQVKIPGGLFGDGEQETEPATRFDGVWRRDPGDQVGIRHHTYGGIYNVSYANRATGLIHSHAIGRFKDTPQGIIEAAKFTTDDWSFLRKPIGYRVTFESDNVISMFSPQDSHEIWSRKVAEADKKTLDPVVDFSTEQTYLDGIWIYDGMSGKTRYRAIVIYDHGRFSNTHIEFDSKRASRHMIGLYSLKGDLMRYKIQYCTELWKDKIGAEGVLTVDYQGSRCSQIHEGGYREDFRLVGKGANPELGKARMKEIKLAAKK